MTLARHFTLLLSLVPILLLAVSPLFPRGTDPRGFGPAFAVSVVALIASIAFGIAGIALLVFSRRFRFSAPLVAVATFVAAAPFLYLLIAILRGHA
jgi:hypothetical protein